MLTIRINPPAFHLDIWLYFPITNRFCLDEIVFFADPIRTGLNLTKKDTKENGKRENCSCKRTGGALLG